MPALVPRAVGLGEDLDKEIPFAAREVVPGERRLLAHALDEPTRERDEFRGRSMVGVTGARLGVRAEACQDFALQRARPRLESVVGVVRAPLDHLDPVETGRHAAERHVADGDSPAGAAEMVPERLALHELARVAPIELVGARAKLDETVDAVSRGRDPGVERRPRRADVETIEALRAADQSAGHQRAERRQHAGRRPRVDERSAPGIDAQAEHTDSRAHESWPSSPSAAATRRADPKTRWRV